MKAKAKPKIGRPKLSRAILAARAENKRRKKQLATQPMGYLTKIKTVIREERRRVEALEYEKQQKEKTRRRKVKQAIKALNEKERTLTHSLKSYDAKKGRMKSGVKGGLG